MKSNEEIYSIQQVDIDICKKNIGKWVHKYLVFAQISNQIFQG